MLRTIKALEDRKWTEQYNRLAASGAGTVIASTLGGFGDLCAQQGRYKSDHFSDDQAIYTNPFALYFNSDDEDEERDQDLETLRMFPHGKRLISKLDAENTESIELPSCGRRDR